MQRTSTALVACVAGCILHVPAAKAQTESVLYSFCSQTNCTDGEAPVGSVIIVNGTLYGTTSQGGTGYPTGYGTVFAVDRNTGAETVLHSFTGGADGAYPDAPLVNVEGTLYGTTADGGTGSCSNGCGTVFSVDPATAAETVLHSFQDDGTDGHGPLAALINVKKTLYGTTGGGGTYGDGTVFSLDLKTGAETVLYSFQDNGTDGYDPVAALINVKGVLYGTTTRGGTYGDGTVFSLDLKTRVEAVLHSFQDNGTDGYDPKAGLIRVKDTIYGTTASGGVYGGSTYSGGAVFALDLKTGAETVLHSFGDSTDGAYPKAGLINLKGTFYGTTTFGGTNSCGTYGCGTAFSLDLKTGVETVLHSFCSPQNCTDGNTPESGLLNVRGTLYGTTESGGTRYDYGTVFSIVP